MVMNRMNRTTIRCGACCYVCMHRAILSKYKVGLAPSTGGSRARSPSIDGSQNRLPSLRYFGLPPSRPLRLALVDPTDRILKGVEARSRRTCSLINNACFPASSLLSRLVDATTTSSPILFCVGASSSESDHRELVPAGLTPVTLIHPQS